MSFHEKNHRLFLMVAVFLMALNFWVSDVKANTQKPIGEIGADNSDLKDLVTQYLIYYIKLKTDFPVVKTDVDVITMNANKGEDKMSITVKGLSISSNNILSEPMRAILSLEVEVINNVGEVIYLDTKQGEYDLLVYSLMQSEQIRMLTETTVKNALKNFLNDPALRKIMVKYKYGALGSIVSLL